MIRPASWLLTLGLAVRGRGMWQPERTPSLAAR